MAAAMAFPPSKVGTYIFVNYGVEGEPWHERYVACRVDATGHRVVIITPGDDMYVEDLRDMLAWLPRPTATRTLPAGLGGACGQLYYRFSRDIPVARRIIIEAEARQEAAAERERLGLSALPEVARASAGHEPEGDRAEVNPLPEPVRDRLDPVRDEARDALGAGAVPP